jgi:DNA-binding NtrC family response regulator
MPSATPKIDKKVKDSISMEEFQGDGSRVLVVEDERGVKDFTTEALKENGYRVLSAGSAGEAISVFEKEDGQVDLVLSDVVLSDRNGIELVDELLLRKPELKIILCSGYTGKKSQWFVIQQRGFRFLQKPYSMIDLIRAVKETFTSN